MKYTLEFVGSIISFFNKNERKSASENLDLQFCANIAEYKFNMFRLAKSILHNDADAEDAVGEAILKAYANLSSLRNMKSFKSWIMRIVINESYAISNNRKRIIYVDEIEIEKKVKATEDNGLWEIVKDIDDEFRVVTILFYYEDLSLKEISRVLDLPLGTVKSRLFRARNKLKNLLNERGYNFE